MGNGQDGVWCRACGHAGIRQATSCPSCGAELTDGRPESGVGGRVGVVAKVSRLAVLSRPVICTAEDAEHVQVLVKGDDVATYTLEAFDELAKIDLDGPEMRSGAGRLLQAAKAAESGQLKSNWNQVQVAELAHTLAERSVTEKRAALHDWVALGLDDDVDELELSDAEVAWAHAHYAASTGDTAATLEWVGRLPASGYGAKVGLLMALAPAIVADEALVAAALEAVRPFAAVDVEARALAAVLERRTDAAVLGVARELAEALSSSEEGSERAAALRAALAECERLCALEGATGQGETAPRTRPDGAPVPASLDGSLRALTALGLYHAGMQGENLDGDRERLVPVTLPLWDDLVDAGALTAGFARPAAAGAGAGAGAGLSPYASARLDPGGAGAGALADVGHVAELARRCFLAGDAGGFAKFDGEHEAVRHYEALLRVMTNEGRGGEGLRPQAAELLAVIEAYRAALAEAAEPPVPEAVLADPSCWRLLQREARRGRIRLSRDQRAAAPRFATWLALYDMQACVFARDWTAVRQAGDPLLADLEDEILRDEVLNMAAYAQFQLGNDAVAIDLLTQALQGRHTGALLVNASIVARESSAEEAAVFLAQLYYEAKDAAVGIAAVVRSIELWYADDRTVVLPESIAGALRSALGRPMPDDTLRRMLKVAAAHDAAWLSSGPAIAAVNPSQQDLVAVYTARARASEPGRPETMREMAVALVAAKARQQVAGWVDQELDALLRELMDLVHVPFGEGAYLVPTITALLALPTLSLERYVIFSAQAGAHLATSLKDRGERLTTAGEKRFLLEPLERFLARRSELTPEAQEVVAEELERCLVVSALALADVTSIAAQRFAREWDSLVERARYDVQNRGAVRNREVTILQVFNGEVQRLELFNRQLARMRLSQKSRGVYQDIEAQVLKWQHEIARLRRSI